MNRTLVIGYGNTLRSDDGAGIRAAELITQQHPTIDCLTVPELKPEIAEIIRSYDRVVFIDAAVNTTSLNVQTISSAPTNRVTGTHTLSPERLVTMCRDLYSTSPTSVVLMEIPAHQFQFGEQLSSETEQSVQHCVQQFARLVESRDTATKNQ